MIEALQNIARAQAEQANAATLSARIGIVTSFDPKNYAVKVMIQPEGVETGWLPVLTPWAGNGWGLQCPPSPGDAVDVRFQEGNFESGYVSLRFFNDTSRPLNVPAGEFWLVHKSGAYIKLKNSGAIEIHAATIASSGAWNHSGNITVSGGDVTADGIHLKTHTHGGVQGGGSSTGGPQ